MDQEVSYFLIRRKKTKNKQQERTNHNLFFIFYFLFFTFSLSDRKDKTTVRCGCRIRVLQQQQQQQQQPKIRTRRITRIHGHFTVRISEPHGGEIKINSFLQNNVFFFFTIHDMIDYLIFNAIGTSR